MLAALRANLGQQRVPSRVTRGLCRLDVSMQTFAQEIQGGVGGHRVPPLMIGWLMAAGPVSRAARIAAERDEGGSGGKVADRNPGRHRDLLVAQLRQRQQQQRVAIITRQVGKRRAEYRRQRAGVQAGVRLIDGVARVSRWERSPRRPPVPMLATGALAQQVSRNPVQPGPRARLIRSYAARPANARTNVSLASSSAVARPARRHRYRQISS